MKGITINFEEGKIYRSIHNGKYYKYEDGLFFERNDYGKWENASISLNFITNTEFKEIKKEIDWDKVPRWTPVQVDDGFGLLINAYYFEYSNDKPYCHGYTTRDKFCFETDSVVDYCTKGKCKIHPSIEVKEEWYKEA